MRLQYTLRRHRGRRGRKQRAIPWVSSPMSSPNSISTAGRAEIPAIPLRFHLRRCARCNEALPTTYYCVRTPWFELNPPPINTHSKRSSSNADWKKHKPICGAFTAKAKRAANDGYKVDPKDATVFLKWFYAYRDIWISIPCCIYPHARSESFWMWAAHAPGSRCLSTTSSEHC
jgi:hypothetical protein